MNAQSSDHTSPTQADPYEGTPRLTDEEHRLLIQDAYKRAANMMQAGVAKDHVRKVLSGKGLNQEEVNTIMGTLIRLEREAINKSANRNIIIGGVIMVIGIVVTAGSYMMAEGGGRYVIAWGAVIFGGIQFLRGMGQRKGK